MSDKGFFKQAMSEKQSSFKRLKKLLIVIAPTSFHERFTGNVRDWGILNSDWPIQKINFTNISMEESMPKIIATLVFYAYL